MVYFFLVKSSNIALIQESFQDGCSTIAAAITSMGITTASNASPDTMAANIKKISKSFTTTMQVKLCVPSGSTPGFYLPIANVSSVKLTGTVPSARKFTVSNSNDISTAADNIIITKAGGFSMSNLALTLSQYPNGIVMRLVKDTSYNNMTLTVAVTYSS